MQRAKQAPRRVIYSPSLGAYLQNHFKSENIYYCSRNEKQLNTTQLGRGGRKGKEWEGKASKCQLGKGIENIETLINQMTV